MHQPDVPPTSIELFTRSLVRHSAEIMRADVDGRFGVGLILGSDVKIVQIAITRSSVDALDSVWDQVSVDGQHCGNRCGGVARFGEIAAAFLAEHLEKHQLRFLEKTAS